MSKEIWLSEVAGLPGMPAGKKLREWHSPRIKQHLRDSTIWLYPPPYRTLDAIAECEHWDEVRRAELGIPLAENYLIADFGPGTDEAVVLDCSAATGGRIRHLRDRQEEAVAYECPVVFDSIAEFAREILDDAGTP